MKFFSKNSWAILLLIGAIANEYLHYNIGVVTYHSNYVNTFGERITISLSDVVYYFTHSLFILFVIIAIFVHIDKKKLASKVTMSGVVIWFVIEAIEAYCYLMKINENMIKTNEWSFFQILISIGAGFAGYYGFRKYKQ